MSSSSLLLVFLCIYNFIFIFSESQNGYSCLDENGQPVDHWIALAQNNKYQYYYYDTINGFMKSRYRTNQTSNGCIMSTVNQLYDSNLDLNNIAYALYNDDPPPPLDVASSTYAHSKGVVLVNNVSGFWLVHSKPNWPNQRTGGPVPFPDTTYSQSLMCITMNTLMFETVASGFLINYPYIYDSYASPNLANILPTFNNWINKGKSTVKNMTYEITSLDGTKFLQFAKSKSWGRDLYDDFVAPFLNQSIHVETWRSGSGGRMGSVCEDTDDDTWTVHPNTYDIIEVAVVTMPDGGTWKGTEDHSKWVSSIGSGFICIGDINRMCSQEGRGGGTVCLTDASSHLWNSFNNAITSTEDCWAYNPCAGSSTQCYWCPSKPPTLKPTFIPTASTGPSISSSPTVLLEVLAGDIAIVLFNTDNPDTFSVVALSTLPSGYVVKFTDNGWTGSALNSNEGTLQFTTSSVISPGSTWSYDGTTMITAYGTWAKIQGAFSLATAGDQILVYSGDSTSPYFLFGLSTIPWVSQGTAIDTTTSILPSTLLGANASIFFSDIDNGVYNGTNVGTKSELQSWICTSSSWLKSDTLLYSPSQLQSFVVVEATSVPTFLPSLCPSKYPTLTPTQNPTFEPTSTPSIFPSLWPSSNPTKSPTRSPTTMYETLTTNMRTIECYSDCSYPEMTLSPANWTLLEYCAFYQSTSCTYQSVSSATCCPTCLIDCIDVYCDTMSSLVFLCDPDMISSYHNISLVQSSCLDAYSSSAPTKTLMTFLTTIVFNNVDTLDMETIESQMVAIIGMEMSLSGVPVDDITINNVVDGNAALERRYLGTTEDVTNVTYKFSIVLETLGYDQSSGSSAYTQITNEIDSAVADGNLQRNLIAAGETAGIVTFSGLTITTQPQYTTAVFDSLETAMPTPSPTTVDHSNGNSGRSNVPATVFYALGSVVALALVGLGILMVMKRNHKSETFGSNIEIETRNTLTEKYLRY